VLNQLYANLQEHKQSWLAVLAALALIFVLQKLTDNRSPSDSLDDASRTDANVAESQPLKAVPKVGSIHTLSPELQALAYSNQFDSLRSELLDGAMNAVEASNDAALANNIALLGLAALEELDLDSASIYLNEALELYDELEDPLGTASVSLHIGRMHILERRQARRAALAYDASLLARWKIAHGQFAEAEPSIRNAIAENIALNRHGAAAVDFETLYQGHLKQGDTIEAESAALSAARLHAESGRLDAAHSLLEDLQQRSLLTNDINDYTQELSSLHQEYEKSVNMIGQARDYTQLYNYYIAKQDPVRAWRFRLKANTVQQQTSKRARYRRQSGVLVLLYNSNDSMRRAHSSLIRAQRLFTENDVETLANQSAQLMQEVF